MSLRECCLGKSRPCLQLRLNTVTASSTSSQKAIAGRVMSTIPVRTKSHQWCMWPHSQSDVVCTSASLLSTYVCCSAQMLATVHITCNEAASRLAVGIPSSFEPRPKPLTTLPFSLQTGSRGTVPLIMSSKGASPYCSGLKSRREGSREQQPADQGMG